MFIVGERRRVLGDKVCRCLEDQGVPYLYGGRGRRVAEEGDDRTGQPDVQRSNLSTMDKGQSRQPH